MKTEELIQRLGKELTPVRPLASPWRRAAVWLGVGTAYIVAVASWAMFRHGGLPGASIDAVYVVQQLALLGTALAAALAAFASVVPGERRTSWTLRVPALIVLATMLWGAIRDLTAAGTLGIGRETDWPCVRSIVLGGLVLWAVAAAMLRRGAAVAPVRTSLLAAGAALSIVNIEACLTRTHAFTMTLVVWHLPAAVLGALVALACGRRLLTWPQTPPTHAAAKVR